MPIPITAATEPPPWMRSATAAAAINSSAISSMRLTTALAHMAHRAGTWIAPVRRVRAQFQKKPPIFQMPAAKRMGQRYLPDGGDPAPLPGEADGPDQSRPRRVQPARQQDGQEQAQAYWAALPPPPRTDCSGRPVYSCTTRCPGRSGWGGIGPEQGGEQAHVPRRSISSQPPSRHRSRYSRCASRPPCRRRVGEQVGAVFTIGTLCPLEIWRSTDPPSSAPSPGRPAR